MPDGNHCNGNFLSLKSEYPLNNNPDVWMNAFNLVPGSNVYPTYANRANFEVGTHRQ